MLAVDARILVSIMAAACTPTANDSDTTPVADPAPESPQDQPAEPPRVAPEPTTSLAEQATAQIELAKLAERRGSGAEAAEHMRRAQALHPSTYAEQWLAGGRNCSVEVLAKSSELVSSETWHSAITRLAGVADIRLRAKPNSQAAAQRLVCGEHRCDGPGPWIIGLMTPADEGIEYLAVVLPRSDGTLVMLEDGWYSNPSWPCNHTNRLRAERVADTSELIHVRVERASGVGEWHSCTPEGTEGCVEYCREAAVITYDWFLDPDTLATLALTTRTKKPGPWDGREDIDEIADASSVGGDVDLVVDGRSVELIGCGVHQRLSL